MAILNFDFSVYMDQSNSESYKPIKKVIAKFKDYWLSDASFSLLSGILIFRVFVLPILIDYGKVETIFVNTVFPFCSSLEYGLQGYESDNSYLFDFLCSIGTQDIMIQ